jgi:hypothetical protein
VTVPPGALSLARADGLVIPLNVATSVSGSVTTVVMTFGGPDVTAGSVPDGNYRLTVDGDQIVGPGGQLLDGDGDNVPGGDFVLAFHRLFGDADGDRDVDASDFAALRGTFGRAPSDSAYRAYFDSDGDNDVDATDFAAFRTRFGVTIAPVP